MQDEVGMLTARSRAAVDESKRIRANLPKETQGTSQPVGTPRADPFAQRTVEFKGKMFSAEQAQKCLVKNLMGSLPGDFRTTNNVAYKGGSKSKEEWELDKEHLIYMPDDSFSRYAQEALLKGVDLSADGHDTMSPRKKAA